MMKTVLKLVQQIMNIKPRNNVEYSGIKQSQDRINLHRQPIEPRTEDAHIKELAMQWRSNGGSSERIKRG